MGLLQSRTSDDSSLQQSEEDETQQSEDVEKTEITEDRPLPPTEELLDAHLLATFQCPFQQNIDPSVCSIKHCPFGHQTQMIQGRHLRMVPSYLCLDRLLDQCASQNIESLTDQAAGLARCENGLHLSNEHLADVEQLVEQLASLVMARKAPTPARTLDCVICLKMIPPSSDGLYGFLENCKHSFCSRCIIAWRARHQRHEEGQLTDFNCPTCREPSSRIFLWPRPLFNANDQQRLFNLQKRCFGVMVAPKTSASVIEIPNSNELAIGYKRVLMRARMPTRGNRPA